MPDGKLRRYEAEDATPDQFRVGAIHDARRRRGLGRRRRTGLYRLPAGSTSHRLERVAVGKEKPDGVRGFAEDPSGTLYAASKQGILRLTGDAPRKFTQLDGLREDFLSSIAFASDGSLVVAYRESIGAAKVIIEGDRLTVQPIARATGLVSNKVVLLGRDAAGALWIGTGIGRRRVRAGLVADRAVREARRDDQRGPRPERVLRRARRHGLARLEPGPDPLPGRHDARRRSRRRPS